MVSYDVLPNTIDVINVYNVYQKILCKRVYYFVKVYLNKNHISETKQNYDGKPSYSALRSIRSLIEFTGSRCLMMEHLLHSRRLD